VPVVGPDGGEPEEGALPEVLEGDLRRSDVEPVPGAVEDRSDDRPLLLQRMRVGQVQIRFQRNYVRGISRSS
jgi:hypothetical protein